jgi:hypothetical protein
MRTRKAIRVQEYTKVPKQRWWHEEIQIIQKI